MNKDRLYYLNLAFLSLFGIMVFLALAFVSSWFSLPLIVCAALFARNRTKAGF